jgi:hypothetical protein
METLAMLEAATLIVAISAVIVSAVVPFLSVHAAQSLVRRDALRESVRDAFLRVSRHIQESFAIARTTGAKHVSSLESVFSSRAASPDVPVSTV